MFSIRPATPQDAASISRVHVQSWRTTYAGIVPEPYLASLDEAERTLLWNDWLRAPDVEIFVAEWNGETVGFVGGGSIREALPGYDAELFAIYLLEPAQKRGIGTALLRSLAEALRARRYNSMAVWVLESNSSSRFYEKSGALRLASKEIEIAGVLLPVLAFGWRDLDTLLAPS